MRPAQAQADVLERKLVAALLVVDDKRAVLQADLVEVLAVEAGQAEAVEPIEPRKQSAGRSARGLCRCGGLSLRRGLARRSVGSIRGCAGLVDGCAGLAASGS